MNIEKKKKQIAEKKRKAAEKASRGEGDLKVFFFVILGFKSIICN